MNVTTVQSIDPCPSCGHVPDQAARLHYLAGCLSTHVVVSQLNVQRLAYEIVHFWRDDQTYAAIRRDHREYTEAELLAWLDLCHSGQLTRRPWEFGTELDFEPWRPR